jgi:hypothetical protein
LLATSQDAIQLSKSGSTMRVDDVVGNVVPCPYNPGR